MPDYTSKLNLPRPLGSENVRRSAHNDLVDAIEGNAQKHIAQGTTESSSPVTDDLWIDTSSTPHILKRYDGAAWVSVAPVESVNGKTGAVQLDATDVGAETPSGAQTKADTAESNANGYTDQEVSTVQQNLTSHQDEDASEDNVHGLRSNSLALGSNSEHSGDHEVAIGRFARAMGPLSIAIGTQRNTISGQTTAYSEGSIAIGSQTVAEGRFDLAVGRRALSKGSASGNLPSIAIGDNSNATGFMAIALGAYAEAGEGSAALGVNTSVGGDSSVALGHSSEALNDKEGVLGGIGGSRTNAWIVPGNFTVEGTKNFEIPHPHPDKKDTHRIRHAAVESPTAGDTLYRYEVEATEDEETVELTLPDYFEYLNKDVDVWVNGLDHFGNAFAKVEGDILKVTCQFAGKYKCLVIGTRNDDHDSIQNWDIKGVEREIGESWTGETYVFSDDEIIVEDEYIEEEIA